MPRGQRSPAPELPGFYFDPEKNRYYRIPPFPHSSGDSYTPKKRKKGPGPTKVTKNAEATPKKRKISFARLLVQRSLGLSLKETFQFEAEKLETNTFGEAVELCAPFSWDVFDLVPSLDYNALWWINVTDVNSECVGFRSGNVCQTNLFRLSKSTNLNPFRISEGSFAICTDVENSTVCVMKERRDKVVKQVKNATLFACAGAKHSHSQVELSYSDGPKAILVKSTADHFTDNFYSSRFASRDRRSSVVLLHKDILAQCFGWNSGLIFNGLRGGEVIGVDPRQRRINASQMKLCQRINVAQIVSLKDDRSLICTYRNPQSTPLILLWDFRFTSKPFLEYTSDCSVDEMRDPIAKYRLRINVDQEERVLCCVLPDLKVRLWDIKTGEEFFKDSVVDEPLQATVAAYSSQWNINVGKSKHGIFLGTSENGLHWCGR